MTSTRGTRGRLTVAVAVLVLAAMSLGGGGYAAAKGVKIGAHQLKKNAVSSKAVKDDSLTGHDIDESTLGTVPSAASASRVTGFNVSRVNLTTSHEGDPVLFSGSGLTIIGDCGFSDMRLFARTQVGGAAIYADLTDLDQKIVHASYLEAGTFNPGSAFDLLAGATDPEADPALITFTYDAPSGSVVTGTLSTLKDAFDSCHFTGTVTES